MPWTPFEQSRQHGGDDAAGLAHHLGFRAPTSDLNATAGLSGMRRTV